MYWVRVNRQDINVEQISHIYHLPDDILIICFVGAQTTLRLSGQDAELFRAWLEENIHEILAPTLQTHDA